MKDNGIEDILIGETYKSSKKKRKGPVIFIIILLMAVVAFAEWHFFTNKEIVNEKVLFSNSLLSSNTKKMLDNDFYSTIFDRILQENSEMSTNITISSTENIDALEGIDINNFDFELTSQNDLKEKNFYTELLLKYSGNDFLKFKGIVNDNKFAIISDEIVNKYVGVRSQNFNDIFGSNIDLQFIYELINSEKIDLTEEERKTYLENYYNKIYNQIPLENFSKKDNYVITKKSDYIDVTAYEMVLNQSELNDIIVNLLTEIKNDEKLLNAIVLKDVVELDLSGNEVNQDELEVRDGGESISLQLLPVSEVNFQTAEEINTEENLEEFSQENFENEIEDVENVSEENEQAQELSLSTNEDFENKEFTTSDLIKILLGRKVNISIDKIVEKIDEYIENLEGSGLTVTIYVSDEKTEKISLILPDENKIDIQFLENTDKENTIEITYLYKASDYKDGFSVNIDEIHNSASSSIKVVRNYIEDERINKKVSFSIETEGTKNASSISNDIVITISTNSDETKIIAENKIKFLSDNFILEKLTEENSVFLDDLEIEERELTIQAIKEKIDFVLDEKKNNMNLIDLNSGNSIVGQNLNNTTANNYLLIKNALQNKINTLRDETIENGEEFTLQNLNDLSIDGYEVTTNVYEDRAVVVVDIYTFNVDMDFNVSDT